MSREKPLFGAFLLDFSEPIVAVMFRVCFSRISLIVQEM